MQFINMQVKVCGIERFSKSNEQSSGGKKNEFNQPGLKIACWLCLEQQGREGSGGRSRKVRFHGNLFISEGKWV